MPTDPRAGEAMLIIEDEAQIRQIVKQALELDLRVLEAATARAGLALAAAENPAIVVLDLGLPDLPGITVCRELRKWSSVPIVVLSVMQSERDMVQLLEAGADDFITKPFSALELRARVLACLRRARAPRQPPAQPIEIGGGLVLDLAGRTLKRQGRALHLTPIEWELLRALVTQAGRTLTHPQLLAAVWGGAGEDRFRAHLRVHLANLRRKIERDAVRPVLIVTEPGVGYRFELPG
ncbi:MAG TPA: response regulator transcription factor [Thermoanaerobaculia bacterium]|nr:response regulator transcription factor [Thermoanaerobaculia bacterium]